MEDNILFIIPARSGSKRLKNKNKRNLDGKPLIQHSIEFAKSVCNLTDKILVTSDDKSILDLSQSLKVDFIIERPSSLSSDTASTEDVLLHAVKSIEFQPKWIVLLQPTSPIRLKKDFENMMRIANQDKTEILVSISEYKMSENNIFRRLNKENNHFEPAKGLSQEKYFYKNGSFYIIHYSSFISSGTINFDITKGYITREDFSIDIDTLLDFQLAEVVINNLNTIKN